MATLSKKTVFGVGAELGLVIAVVMFGAVVGVLAGVGRREDDPADLMVTVSGDGSVVYEVEALTPDGDAFIELVTA